MTEQETWSIRFNKRFLVAGGVLNDFEGIKSFIREEMVAQRKSDMREVEKEIQKKLKGSNPDTRSDYWWYNEAVRDISSIIKRVMEK